MSKPSTSRKRRKGPKFARPDEYFKAGPIEFARFGRDTVFSTDWDPATYERMQEKIAAGYDDLVSSIDQLVAEIATLVSRLPPEKLLHRAWWELAVRTLKIETEVEVGQEDALAMRMIDYVQSVIASVPADPEQLDDISEEDWSDLLGKIEELFRKVNQDFQIASSIKSKRENPDFDHEVEEFKFRAQIYWANVRGVRHYNHQVEAIEDLLGGQDEVLMAVFGLSSAEIVDGLREIWHSLIFGMGEAYKDMEEARRTTLAFLESELPDDFLSGDPSDIQQKVLTEAGVSEIAHSAAGKLLGFDLFDLQKVTNLPDEFLRALSWEVGENSEFFAEGPYKGWPLRIWPIFERPFIRINGKSYCFDVHSLFDHIYRALEKLVFSHSKEEKQKWLNNRKAVSENLPVKFFQEILDGCKVYSEVYYPKGERKKDGLAELDHLIVYDDHIIILEVKAGSYTYTSPADDFGAHVASFKALLESPAKQAKRFENYLKSKDEIDLLNAKGEVQATLRSRDYRKVTVCAVSVDPFTEFAAQARHLRKLGVQQLEEPVWAISVDDLRVFSELFETPLEFLHFLEQRTRAFESDLLQLDDELDHVGLYLSHNNYAQHAEEKVGGNNVKFSVLGYRSEIDRFFAQKLDNNGVVSPLSQDMPPRMREMIDWLSNSERPGRAKLASAILDLDGDARREIYGLIDEQIGRAIAQGKSLALSSFGEVRITVHPHVPPYTEINPEESAEFARAIIASQGEPDRLLIQPTYIDGKRLSGVVWRTVTNVGLAASRLNDLGHHGAFLKAKRVSESRLSTGRNDPCPCGSGQKFKKCCL